MCGRIEMLLIGKGAPICAFVTNEAQLPVGVTRDAELSNPLARVAFSIPLPSVPTTPFDHFVVRRMPLDAKIAVDHAVGSGYRSFLVVVRGCECDRSQLFTKEVGVLPDRGHAIGVRVPTVVVQVRRVCGEVP